MTEHPLDRPVWASLTSMHQGFSAGAGGARRFQPDVNPLAGLRDEDPESVDDLADLVDRTGSLVIAQAPDVAFPPNIRVVARSRAFQYVYSGGKPRTFGKAAPEALADTDADAMIALAELTNPGPFGPRTRELGRFWGVKSDGRLIAMAGERLKSPGFVEVSGVCTHPDARGRGLGRMLCNHVCRLILERGDTPYLHVFEDNAAAIALYEDLGYEARTRINVFVLDRAAAIESPDANRPSS